MEKSFKEFVYERAKFYGIDVEDVADNEKGGFYFEKNGKPVHISELSNEEIFGKVYNEDIEDAEVYTYVNIKKMEFRNNGYNNLYKRFNKFNKFSEGKVA